MKVYSILVVDDDAQVCSILLDLFEREGYVTHTAENGKVALEKIDAVQPDLVISDIQMPQMDGFELFEILKNEYPHIKHIMMTSFDVDQYIVHIRKFNIGNILVKGFDFNLAEVAAYVRAILTGEIFGLKRHFPETRLYEVAVRSYAQAKDVCTHISGAYPDKKGFFLEIAIDELISNAIFHGVLQLSHTPRDEWSQDMQIDASDAVKVVWGADGEKIGVSIEDPKGNLKKNDVLKWLDTYREPAEHEEHGRGFLLVRRLIDRLIINIDPGKRTECIIIQYFKHPHNVHNKPLLIHEL